MTLDTDRSIGGPDPRSRPAPPCRHWRLGQVCLLPRNEAERREAPTTAAWPLTASSATGVSADGTPWASFVKASSKVAQLG